MKSKEQAPDPDAKKKVGRALKWFFGALVGIPLFIIFNPFIDRPAPYVSEREQMLKEKSGKAGLLAANAREWAVNPKSFEFDRATYYGPDADRTYVCVEYYAANRMGGTVKEAIIWYEDDTAGTQTEKAARCQGHDITQWTKNRIPSGR